MLPEGLAQKGGKMEKIFHPSYYMEQARERLGEKILENINTYFQGKGDWEEVNTYSEYILRCYQVASQVQLCEIEKKVYQAKYQKPDECRRTLEEVYDKIGDYFIIIRNQDQPLKGLTTPLTQVRKNLIELNKKVLLQLEELQSEQKEKKSP